MHIDSLIRSVIINCALAGVAVAQNTPTYVPTNGLVGWWEFNEGGADSSGNGLDLTLNKSAFSQDRFGITNAAFDLDGTNWGEIQQPTTFNAGSWTYSYWINPRSYSGSPLFIESSYGYTDVFDGIGLSTVIGTTLGIQFCFVDSPSLNQWTHAVTSFNQDSNTLSIFLDGALVCTSPTTGTLSQDLKEIWIGKRPNDTGFYNGMIDDIGIWNRALSDKEVASIYSAAPNGVPEGGPLTIFVALTLASMGVASHRFSRKPRD